MTKFLHKIEGDEFNKFKPILDHHDSKIDELLNEAKSLRDDERELAKRKNEIVQKKMAINKALWEEVNNFIGPENKDKKLAIDTDYKELGFVVIKEVDDSEDDEDCDCPACKIKGVLGDIIKAKL